MLHFFSLFGQVLLCGYSHLDHLFVSCSPATVILIMTGGLQEAWPVNGEAVLIILCLITFGYGLICLYTSQDFQLMAAKVLTLLFSLLMSAVFIGILIQTATNPEGKPRSTTKPGTVKPFTTS